MLRTFSLMLLVTLVACKPSEDKVTEAVVASEKSDTTIVIRINGRKQLFRIKKENLKKMAKFQTFLNQYPEIPKLYVDTLSVDLTGDGIDEKIISKITCNNKDCSIFSIILKDEKVILSDTLMPNNDPAYMDWNEDSIYFKLKPYSTFYDALLEKNRVQEPENGKISEDLIDFYTSPLFGELQEINKDTLRTRLAVDSVKQELRQYKGKYVLTFDHWDRGLLFWNRFSNRFEVLYMP